MANILTSPPSSELGPLRLSSSAVLQEVNESPSSPARSRCWPLPSPPPLCSPSRPPSRQPLQSTTTAAARNTSTSITVPTSPTSTEPTRGSTLGSRQPLQSTTTAA